jgi:hypothetical protein
LRCALNPFSCQVDGVRSLKPAALNRSKALSKKHAA